MEMFSQLEYDQVLPSESPFAKYVTRYMGGFELQRVLERGLELRWNSRQYCNAIKHFGKVIVPWKASGPYPN